jgi:hypothetical protein
MSSHRSSAVARRFVVAAVALTGIALSGLATARVGAAPGAYVGQVEVIVHPPRTAWEPNPIATVNQNAISFAGLIAEVATGGVEIPRVTSQSLTLADQGMRHQTVISLVNLGGQWANDFSRPFIRIEAVDSSAAAVQQRLSGGVAQVERAMTELEQGAGVAATARASIEPVPATPLIGYEGTHRPRAMAMTLLLALLLTLLLSRATARRLTATRLRPVNDRGRVLRRPTKTRERHFA